MKKCFTFIFSVMTLLPVMAQTAVETTISADFVNDYVWRGLNLGGASVQPTLGISYKGLSLSAWGSYGLTNPDDTKELDLTLSYTLGGLNIGVTDYWLSEGLDPDGRYLKYNAHGTNHVFEANIGYDFGVASLQWYTNFGGNDGVNKDGDRAYSSYVEATVPFTLGGVDWSATAGAVPFSTDYYETSGLAVTNLSLKAARTVKVTDTFGIPFFAQIAVNPCSQNTYFVLGMTISVE